MNLPNKLTLIRIVMVPFFVAAMLTQSMPNNYLWAVGIFAVASFTDFLDGAIARKYSLITDFGKIMDPLADKVLTISALICFIPAFGLSPVVVIIIISREFLVTSLRLVASNKGVVIAADGWGKAKTVSTMAWIICTLLSTRYTLGGMADMLNLFGMICTTALTVISGVNYVWQNRHLLKDA